MLDRILTDLLQNQNPNGGWGALRGKRSNTETTSLAVMALQALAGEATADNHKRGIEWLVRQQNENHSWPLNETVKEGSWTTALAITALGDSAERRERVLAAARWLLEQEGSKPGILAEIVLWATGRSGVNKLNKDLIGWSWVPSSFSWVEPTSYALIALKKQRARLAGTNVEERIRQADAMIYDRMCTGGGWNYGNSKVLDYALWPYPDITAPIAIADGLPLSPTPGTRPCRLPTKISILTAVAPVEMTHRTTLANRNATNGPNASRRNTNQPPARGNVPPSSANVRAPDSAASPPTTHSKRNGPVAGTACATARGVKKIPTPMMPPMTSIVASNGVRRRRSDAGSRASAGEGGDAIARHDTLHDGPAPPGW
jgi:hypothetical protein